MNPILTGEEEEEEESDEYMTDIADADIDDDQYFEEHYQNMHLAGDDEEYASSQEPEDLPINRREKRAWIPHGGRRQRNGQDEEGLESTQGSRKEASQDGAETSQHRHGKRKRLEGDTEGRRSKVGRMDQEQELDLDVNMEVER